jgi:hypothetical protein
MRCKYAFFKNQRSIATKHEVILFFIKDLTMKKPEKNTSTKKASEKPKLRTDQPLAEKDEVKAAEDRQRKKSGK